MTHGASRIDPVIELRGVSKTFRPRRGVSVEAVMEVTLSLGRGEVLGLVGESGAGKSTIARLVLGLDRPDAGQVLFEGADISVMRPRTLRAVRQRMHLIFQDPYQSLHPGMRIWEAVSEPLVIRGADRRTRHHRAAEVLAEVDLTPASSYLHRFPHSLSGGQRQRVAIARALIGLPALIVADEPTSMLDVSMRAGILDLIETLRSAHGIGVLFVTHDLAVARYVSDRIAVMHEGAVVEVGPAEDVICRPTHPYTSSLIEAVADIAGYDDVGAGRTGDRPLEHVRRQGAPRWNGSD